jgi:hypothetical protein
MANMASLFTWDEPTRPVDNLDEEEPPEGPWLAYAKVRIPLFWLALFDPSSVTTAINQGDDPEFEPEEFPYLVAEMDEALERARGRRQLIGAAIGSGYEALYQTWLGYLEAHRGR